MTDTTFSTADTAYDPRNDTIDAATGLQPSDSRYQMRHAREKIARHTQLSETALFDPRIDSPTVSERLFAAWYTAALTGVPAIVAVYRQRLDAASTDDTRDNVAATRAAVGIIDKVAPEHDAPSSESARKAAYEQIARDASPRLAAIAAHTVMLADAPVLAERGNVDALAAAGLSTAGIVVLSQLIAFVSYQARVAAMVVAMGSASATHGTSAYVPTPGPAEFIDSRPYTFDSLEWQAWADTITLEQASAEQMKVLEESHPKAKTSDYYLLLVHAPEILRQRSLVFNAIMYGTGGLSRAERELGATVVSRVNGCVYCASVHAQRFQQLAKRTDSIEQVYADPATAGVDERERTIVSFAEALTRAPAALDRAAIDALRAQGLDDEEILDLTHSIAIFAWANRLMLTLGEPVAKTA